MDGFALRAANALVGNGPVAAALEVTLGGLVLEVLAPCLVAVTGAALDAQRDGVMLPLWTACYLRAGAILALGMRQSGARAYLAVAGGIDVPAVLGGYSTDLGAGFGGLEGRALRAGGLIKGRLDSSTSDLQRRAGTWLPQARRVTYGATPTLRLIPGPHAHFFAPDALDTLLAAPYRLGPDCNRMGYRLSGAHLAHAGRGEVRSLGVLPGVIQVPSSGQPILLMADAQTTGGYPIIGTVISADLPLAAQLLPGDSVSFACVTLPEAHAALQAQQRMLSLPLPNDELGGPI